MTHFYLGNILQICACLFVCRYLVRAEVFLYEVVNHECTTVYTSMCTLGAGINTEVRQIT